MKRVPRATRLVWLGRMVAFGLMLLGGRQAQAQTWSLDWHTIDGGGLTAGVGGVFELSGTIAQPDAGPAMTGGAFEVRGGFWPAIAAPPCAGDVNGDGQVNIDDLAILLSNFGAAAGASAATGDLDGDGDVELSDLAILLGRFGIVC